MSKFLPFEEAREYARTLGVKTQNEWAAYSKSGLRPSYIPSNPDKAYAEFQGYGDWLDTGNLSNRYRNFLPFEEAREYARSLRLKDLAAWYEFCKSELRPRNIPYCPNEIYADEFQGYGDWLGTGVVALFNREYLPFEEAREQVRALKLVNVKQWVKYCASGQKPEDVPASPEHVYHDEWTSWGDFLGTGTLATYDPEYIPISSERKRAKGRVGGHRYRARKKEVQGSHTYEQILEQLKRQKYRCYYLDCGQAKFPRVKENGAWKYIYVVEHTFPLSRVIGMDIPANDMGYLVLACDSCNGKKHNKFPWEWYPGGRLL